MCRHAIDDAWELARQEAKRLDTILSPIQLRLMPWPANLLYNADKPIVGLRTYITG